MTSEPDSQGGTILDDLKVHLTNMHTVTNRILIAAHKGREDRGVIWNVCRFEWVALSLQELDRLIQLKVKLYLVFFHGRPLNHAFLWDKFRHLHPLWAGQTFLAEQRIQYCGCFCRGKQEFRSPAHLATKDRICPLFAHYLLFGQALLLDHRVQTGLVEVLGELQLVLNAIPHFPSLFLVLIHQLSKVEERYYKVAH